MADLAATALLLTGLVLPVVAFWLLGTRARLGIPVAAGLSIASGWAVNIAWATVAGEATDIAIKFGWACPAVLVLLTWVAQRFVARSRQGPNGH